MLKNRQEGLTALHGIWVTIVVSCLFIEFARLVELTGWIDLVNRNSLNLYFLAVFSGTLISLRTYHQWASKLARLTWIDAIILTKQQMIRLALVLLAFVFLTKDSAVSRMFIGSFLILASFVILLCNRFLPRLICRMVFKTNTVPTLFIGSPLSISRLNHWIEAKTNLGVETLGFLCNEEDATSAAQIQVPLRGTTEDLGRVLRENVVGQIIVLQNYLDRDQNRKVIATAQKTGCRLHVFNNWAEEFNHSIVVDHEGEYTFFTLDDEPLENPINRILKRVFDIAIALPAVALLLPPIVLIVWLMQRRQAPGPVFYTQPRTGMTKRPFNILKFRTMYVRQPGDEATQARRDDQRIYPFGRFLRRTSLDELPQFINVLVGDMSVAGPRPHLIKHDEQFSKLLNTYYTRHFVKPGITGLAQSKGFRGEISELSLLERRVRYDIFYINNWSFVLDLQIVFSTIRQVLFPPRSAY
ncbi:MAG: exopolysaccharide biosynthesis polyprenyl glycosylphosphotransferase [Opitutaceae bacterium]